MRTLATSLPTPLASLSARVRPPAHTGPHTRTLAISSLQPGSLYVFNSKDITGNFNRQALEHLALQAASRPSCSPTPLLINNVNYSPPQSTQLCHAIAPTNIPEGNVTAGSSVTAKDRLDESHAAYHVARGTIPLYGAAATSSAASLARSLSSLHTDRDVGHSAIVQTG